MISFCVRRQLWLCSTAWDSAASVCTAETIHCNVGWINEKPYSCWECPINSHIACIYLRHTQSTCNKNEQSAVSLVTHGPTIIIITSIKWCCSHRVEKELRQLKMTFCVRLFDYFVHSYFASNYTEWAVCISHSLHFITFCDDRNYIFIFFRILKAEYALKRNKSTCQ